MTVLSLAAGWWARGGGAAPVIYRGDLLGGPLVALGPRVSPDGQMVAFQAMSAVLLQLGVARPQSGHWAVLTSDRTKGSVQDVAWAPDGTAIYFDRYLDGPRGVYRVPAIGGDPRLIVENAMTPEAFPDGSLLVIRINEARQKQLFRFWSDTGELKPLNALFADNAPAHSVRVFPDAREAVFRGRPADQPQARIDLYILDLASNRVRPLASTLAHNGRMGPPTGPWPRRCSRSWLAIPHRAENVCRCAGWRHRTCALRGAPGSRLCSAALPLMSLAAGIRLGPYLIEPASGAPLDSRED